MTLHSAKAFPPAVIPRPVCELLRVHPTRLGQHAQLRLDPRGHGVKSSHGIVNGDPKGVRNTVEGVIRGHAITVHLHQKLRLKLGRDHVGELRVAFLNEATVFSGFEPQSPQPT
jgi:hypothetical protein